MSVHFDDTEWRAYDVKAERLAAAADALSRRAEAANTEWLARYTCTTAHGRILSVAVSVKTVVAMPRWSGFASAPVAEQEEWRRFSAALRAHEHGHLDLVVEHLSQVDERLIGRSRAAAQAEWEQALAVLEAASQAYDRATDHGRNEGTRIDIGVDA